MAIAKEELADAGMPAAELAVPGACQIVGTLAQVPPGLTGDA